MARQISTTSGNVELSKVITLDNSITVTNTYQIPVFSTRYNQNQYLPLSIGGVVNAGTATLIPISDLEIGTLLSVNSTFSPITKVNMADGKIYEIRFSNKAPETLAPYTFDPDIRVYENDTPINIINSEDGITYSPSFYSDDYEYNLIFSLFTTGYAELPGGETARIPNLSIACMTFTSLYSIELRALGAETDYSIGYFISDSTQISRGDVLSYLEEAFDVGNVVYLGEYISVWKSYTPQFTGPFEIKITTNTPYGGETSTSGGGGGSYGGGTFGGGGQSSSDDIASTIPVGGANNSIGASSMLYTRYLLSQADLDFIGEWLWTPSLGLNIAKTFVSLAFGSPIDAIISVYAYPFSIGGYLQGYSAQQQVFCYGGARAAIAGTAHMAYALLNNAVSFNWGSLKIDEYWGNFLDYAPHTTVELYLPWGVGFVSLDPNQVMGRTITIATNIDLTKGTCVHNVFDDLGSVIGTYSGQCAKQLPMTSLDNASKIAGITAAAVGTIASAAVGVGEGYRNATGGDPISFTNYGGLEKSGTIMRPKEFNKVAAREAFKQGTKAALASAAALGVSPSHVQRNGSFSDASSFLGVQYPYIIISRPTQSVPEEYGHHYGYPSNIYQGLRYLSGYTEIGEIHLTGIPCTENELKELDSVLKGGVLF